MANRPNANEPTIYQITVKGYLCPEWAAWFGGLTVSTTTNGNTLLTGPIRDQAALFGLLKKVRNLGLTLLAITCNEADFLASEATQITKTTIQNRKKDFHNERNCI